MINPVGMALTLAHYMHREQKYGDLPYMAHVYEVVDLVREHGDTALAVAYLHDVVEDTECKIETIQNLFGDYIAACVQILSDPARDTRKERKEAANEKMRNIPKNTPLELALIIKAADRLANISACVRDSKLSLLSMYREEQSAFAEAAHRPGLNDGLFDKINQLLKENP